MVQAAGKLLETENRPVVIKKWILEQVAWLNVIVVIESMGLPLVGAVTMEHGLLV